MVNLDCPLDSIETCAEYWESPPAGVSMKMYPERINGDIFPESE